MRARHEHFFGREDILRELDEWLRGRESGWLLLTGSPGLGKSAIFPRAAMPRPIRRSAWSRDDRVGDGA